MAETEKTTFESLMKLVGDKGRWQYRVFLFTWLEGILIGFHHLSSAFLGHVPVHHCSLDGLDFPSHWTDIQKKNYSIPLTSDGGYSQCEMFDISSKISSDYEVAMRLRSADKVACDSWTYSTDHGHTIVSEWDLVCDKTALLSTVQGSYMGGVFVGCLFWGWASDKFGRRPSILISVVIQILASVIAAFSVNYVMFIFFRFIIAFSVSGVFECAFVLVMELVSPELRTPMGIMTQFPFGLGVCILPAIAYFFRNWVPLQLAISIPCLVLLVYFREIPESPRWLVQKKRFVEAKDILKKIAKANGNVLPDDEEVVKMLENLDELNEDEGKVVEENKALTTSEKLKEAFQEIEILFATPQLRKRTLNIFYSWLVVAMVYYGLSFNSKNIGGDMYVSMFISGLAECLACLAIIPALSKFGRVKIYSGGFIAGGACCLVVAVMTWVMGKDSMVWLLVTIAMTGKFLVSGTFALSYLYTAELFPTPVRNVAVGGASTFARIGSASAPYIVDILGGISAGIPTIIFGVFSLSAGLFALMLPETLNKQLPETVADVENWNKSEKQIRDES